MSDQENNSEAEVLLPELDQPSKAAVEEDKTEDDPVEDEAEDPVDDSDDENDPEKLKELLKKSNEVKENYKKGMLAAKDKLKKAKQAPKEEFVTKKDFQKKNESDAISALTKGKKANPEIKTNWKEIMKHFSGGRGRGSVASIKLDINDAFILWKHHGGGSDDEGGDEKKAAAELTTEKASGGKTDSNERDKDKKSTPAKRKILRHGGGIDQW